MHSKKQFLPRFIIEMFYPLLLGLLHLIKPEDIRKLKYYSYSFTISYEGLNELLKSFNITPPPSLRRGVYSEEEVIGSIYQLKSEIGKNKGRLNIEKGREILDTLED